MSTEESDLVRSAQSGDREAFALIVRRHLAGMRAVAIAVLGYTSEADDAVQDALIVAMRRLPELSDPGAVGPWLKAVVRNNCRMMLRANRVVLVGDAGHCQGLDPGKPEDVWERAEVQDWVRAALAGLSDPIREVMVLRYFSGFSSYQQIAELCGVPLGTVRSRLRDGRRALAQALQAKPLVAHRYTGELAATLASRQEAEAAIAAGLSGEYHRLVRERFHHDATVILAGNRIGDGAAVVRLMDGVLDAGVRLNLYDAAASGNIMLWETGFHNPPSNPDHCPPAMAWLQVLKEGRVQQLSLAYGRGGSQ